MELHTIGIDLGKTVFHLVGLSLRGEVVVRKRFTRKQLLHFTADLHALADWLQSVGIRTIAMESTGVYWIPIFEMLEEAGMTVLVVNARRIKHVPGRKSDVQDCQWIQRLYSYGLLTGSFPP